MNYWANERQWRRGEVVLHDGDLVRTLARVALEGA